MCWPDSPLTSMKVPPNLVPALQLAASVMSRRDKLRSGVLQTRATTGSEPGVRAQAPDRGAPGRRDKALSQLKSKLVQLSEVYRSEPSRQAELEAQAARCFLQAVLHAEWGDDALSAPEWDTLLSEVWSSLNTDPAHTSDLRKAGAELLSVVEPQSAPA